MSDPQNTVTRTRTFDRARMAEQGRLGGLRKAERAKPSVTLTGAEADALSQAYSLLQRIAQRHAAKLTPSESTDPTPVSEEREEGGHHEAV